MHRQLQRGALLLPRPFPSVVILAAARQARRSFHEAVQLPAEALLERLAGLNRADPGSGEHAGMEEGIAGSVGELDKPVPLTGVEPLDSALHRLF